MNLETFNLRIFLFLMISFVLTFSVTYAQKVKLKKGEVLVDDAVFLHFKSRNHNLEAGFLKPDTGEEIVSVVWFDNQTPQYREDDWAKILFPQQDLFLETTLVGTKKYYIKLLLEYEVLTMDGDIDPQNLNSFIQKFDEKITERTLR